MRVRRFAGLLFAFALAAAGLFPAASIQAAATGLTFQETWSNTSLPDTGNPIALSSPNVARLDAGGPSVVVGDRTGNLFALHLSNGSPVAGWPVHAGGPVDSTPSVVPIGGGLDDIDVGVGNAAVPNVSYGYRAYGPGGALRWAAAVHTLATDKHPAGGVQASLSVGDFDGQPDVVAGSLDEEAYALNAGTGATLAGWPYFTADSVFSTAAVADLYGNGQTEAVMGGASSPGFGIGQYFPAGGHVRILNSHGGVVCNDFTNQEVDSSPAVGPILAAGATGIVVGTGAFWPGASDTDTLKGFDDRCDQAWSDRLDGVTSSSPALADVSGDGSLEAVEGTDRGQSPPGCPGSGCVHGSVWVIDPANGAVSWQEPVTGRVIGSVVTADLTGLGYQDLLVPTTDGVDVIDGRSRGLVTVLNPGFGFQNSPLVTVDPDGAIGITIAGYDGNNQGVVFHYEVEHSNGPRAVAPRAWPMFHHDPQLSGWTGTSSAPTPACSVPGAAIPGYDMVASDGGVFSFRQPFCGSTGGIALHKPVVGMAMAHNRGGYWLVASDGGVFTFGDAGFYGSTGDVLLHKPIVGIAATPDGRGYWLVASDGGVFTFGDAGFAGSTGNIRLAKPIIGMAYDAATGAYWLVASDGGVFSFGSPFYGSMGGVHLNAPIVGVAPTADGHGYWLVASDGGVFSFGDAGFFGSTGNIRLNRPMVGLSGFLG